MQDFAFAVLHGFICRCGFIGQRHLAAFPCAFPLQRRRLTKNSAGRLSSAGKHRSESTLWTIATGGSDRRIFWDLR